MLPRRICAIGFTLFLGLLTFPGAAIEFTLNHRQTAVLASEFLIAHAAPDPASENLPALPLSSLFPWLESVEYLEVTSGPNRSRWNASRLEMEGWDRVKLVRRPDRWEVRVGQDIFEEPKIISVYGAALDVPTLRIWLAAEDEEFQREIESALALRNLKVEWRKTRQPGHLLLNPPQDLLPHLILLEDLDLIRLMSKLTSYRRIIGRSSQWLAAVSADLPPDGYPYPLALDLYDAETSLHWLLAESPNLFDQDSRLPDVLTEIFGMDFTNTSEVINTTTPLEALRGGQAIAALHSPKSGDSETGIDDVPYLSIPAPDGTVSVLRSSYAAIPSGLSSHDAQIAALLLRDAARFHRLSGDSKALPIPLDPRTLRYFDAYERIGRLALSGQMEAVDARALIDAYIAEK